ncbi:MAG: hemolysin family protein [Trueperaceae bacterium]
MIEPLLIFLLILANGVFATAEIAVVSSNRMRLARMAAEGNAGAGAAVRLAATPNRFLSTVQVGITMVGVFSGAFGGAALAKPVATAIARVEVLRPIAPTLGLVLVVLAITYLSLVVGELVPKRIALNAPEKLAARLAPLMVGLSRVAAPLVHLLSLSTEGVLRILRVRPSAETAIGEEDIHMMVEQGIRAGTVEPAEREIIQQAFWLGERRVNAILTPRHQIAWIDLEEPEAMVTELTAERPHARYLVCRGDLDTVAGFVHSRDLLVTCLRGEALDLERVMAAPLFVPETMPALTLLDQFKTSGVHFAVVLDEYGGVEGIVTLGDLLEELVGDVPEASELTSPPVRDLPGGGWSVDGMVELEDLTDLLAAPAFPGSVEDAALDGGRAQVSVRTLGGFVTARLGRVARVGDVVPFAGYHFEVTAMDRLRVARVRVTSQAAQGSRHLRRPGGGSSA